MPKTKKFHGCHRPEPLRFQPAGRLHRPFLVWQGRLGTLGLLFSNHDASSLAEAWYLNNQFILDETMTRFPKLMDVHFNSPDINGIKDDPDFARGMNSAGYGMGKDQLGLILTGIPWPFTETLPGRCALTNPGLRPRGISTGMTRQMPPKGSPSQPTKTPRSPGSLVPQSDQRRQGHRHHWRNRHSH